ncbi:MAG: twin-arginine translocase TatA/TatE family subunit [Ilumatobacter sp.]
MFNLTGSEIIFILLIALVVLGPEKLPGAIRRAMRTYQELRKMGDGFQNEFRSVIDEPMREMRETAGLLKEQIDPAKLAADAEAEAEADARKAAHKEERRREVVEEMNAVGAAEPDTTGAPESTSSNGAEAPTSGADPWDDPIDELDHDASGAWGAPSGAPPQTMAPPAADPADQPPGLPADPTGNPAGDDDEVGANTP